MTNETTALELINRVRKASYRLKAGTPGKEERSAIGWTCTNAADALEAAQALNERLRQEAENHALEARAMKTSLHECYQAVTGATGEPGNWNGAEPVKQYVEAAQARIAELEQHIADMIDDSGQECACGYDNPTDICLGHLPMYRKAQARIAELEGQRQFLWDLLDDIDTLDDACKENDASFRARTRQKQQERWKISSSDGYSVTFRAALEGKG